jgi:CDGSH-type Zn-finger protein
VAARGPLYLRGRITLPGGTHASVVEYTRVALCRCGTSANKPFCDGSHVRIGFDDPGVCPNVPAAAAAADAAPGPLKVSVTADGPLMVEGCVEFRAADGAAFVTEKVWLCRCGHSRNKPFCDGSHRSAGFRG